MTHVYLPCDILKTAFAPLNSPYDAGILSTISLPCRKAGVRVYSNRLDKRVDSPPSMGLMLSDYAWIHNEIFDPAVEGTKAM